MLLSDSLQIHTFRSFLIESTLVSKFCSESFRPKPHPPLRCFAPRCFAPGCFGLQIHTFRPFLIESTLVSKFCSESFRPKPHPPLRRFAPGRFARPPSRFRPIFINKKNY